MESQPGSLLNLFGPDFLFILLVMGGVLALVLFVLSRWNLGRKPTGDSDRPLAARLQALDDLRGSGAISEQEHAEQRRRILAEL